MERINWYMVGSIAAIVAFFAILFGSLFLLSRSDCKRSMAALNQCRTEANCKYEADDIRAYNRCASRWN